MATRKKRLSYREITFEETSHKIAVVEKGNDVPQKEKIKIANLVCEMYATDKFPLSECLLKCGIKSDGTWYKWCDEIEEIEERFIGAKATKSRIYRHNLKERARTSAEKLTTGYVQDLVDRDGKLKYDKKSKTTKIITTKVRNKQVYVRPNASVVLKVLYNMDPENFQSNPVWDPEQDEAVNLPPIIWVDKIEEDD